MRKRYVLFGISFTTFGIAIMLMSIIQVPYTQSIQTEIPQTEITLNQTYSIQEGKFQSYSNTFYFESTLRVTFTIQGENKDIYFWIMNEQEYRHFEAGESFDYFPFVSKWAVVKIDYEWHPHLNEKIYFVWDNTLSDSPRQVTALFYQKWTEIESQATAQNRAIFPKEAAIPPFLIFTIGAAALTHHGLTSKPTPVKEEPLTNGTQSAVPQRNLLRATQNHRDRCNSVTTPEIFVQQLILSCEQTTTLLM